MFPQGIMFNGLIEHLTMLQNNQQAQSRPQTPALPPSVLAAFQNSPHLINQAAMQSLQVSPQLNPSAAVTPQLLSPAIQNMQHSPQQPPSNAPTNQIRLPNRPLLPMAFPWSVGNTPSNSMGPRPVTPQMVHAVMQNQERMGAILENYAASMPNAMPPRQCATPIVRPPRVGHAAGTGRMARVAQPIAQAIQPIAQVAHPIAQVAQPIAQVVQPIAQVTQQIAQVAQPIAQVTQPIVQVAQPFAQVAQPIAQVTQPIAQVSQPIAQVVQPIAQIVQPTPVPSSVSACLSHVSTPDTNPDEPGWAALLEITSVISASYPPSDKDAPITAEKEVQCSLSVLPTTTVEVQTESEEDIEQKATKKRAGEDSAASSKKIKLDDEATSSGESSTKKEDVDTSDEYDGAEVSPTTGEVKCSILPKFCIVFEELGENSQYVDWVQCDICGRWYHAKCIRLSGEKFRPEESFDCCTENRTKETIDAWHGATYRKWRKQTRHRKN